jgi:hypothetical protein
MFSRFLGYKLADRGCVLVERLRKRKRRGFGPPALSKSEEPHLTA